MPRRYRVVDVFAEEKYGGNPLTVVLDAEGLSGGEMQKIAREMNHSETTFVTAPEAKDGAWPVRVFTPTLELPFAGHPTLGTAAVIGESLGVELHLELELKIGRVPVAREGDLLWMRQPAPEFLNVAQFPFAARSLSLEADDVDSTNPPQTVSTGVPFLVVHVNKLEALKRARLDVERFQRLLPRMGAQAILAFSTETESPDADLHARCFTELLGVPEDPATGSANGALAAWLVERGFFGKGEVDVVVEQGLEVGRPSRLHLRAQRLGGGGIEVRVGGKVIAVAEGVLL